MYPLTIFLILAHQAQWIWWRRGWMLLHSLSHLILHSLSHLIQHSVLIRFIGLCACATHIFTCRMQSDIKNIITCYTYPSAILIQELFHSCHLKKKHIASQIILSSSLSELFWDSWTRRGRRRQERQGKSVAAELSSVVGTVHCAVTHHIHSQRGKVHFFQTEKLRSQTGISNAMPQSYLRIQQIWVLMERFQQRGEGYWERERKRQRENVRHKDREANQRRTTHSWLIITTPHHEFLVSILFGCLHLKKIVVSTALHVEDNYCSTVTFHWLTFVSS